jgi:hypothetical protein
MRTRTGRKTLALAAGGALLLGAAVAQAATITVSDGSAAQGATGTITATLAVDSGEEAVGTLNDIEFESGAQISEAMMVATTLSANVAAADLSIPVADASGLPDFGTVVIDSEQIIYQSKDGNNLIVPDGGRGQNGTTAADHTSGADVSVPTALPDCQMSSALSGLNKSAVFSFLPDGCTPAGAENACTSVRAIVIALDNLGTIPNNTALYSCKVLAGSTDGMFPTTCTNPQVSGPPDVGALTATCSGGTFNVGVMPCVGDCNNDSEVSLGEVQVAFNIFLGTADPASCTAADGNNDGEVTLGEVQMAFNNFLNGCPAP